MYLKYARIAIITNIFLATKKYLDMLLPYGKNKRVHCAMKFLKYFKELAPHYDVFILDIVGVLHNGINAFPKAAHCLKEMGQHSHFMVLSNMARPRTFAATNLEQKGISAPPENILTSGEALRYQLVHQTDNLFKSIGTKFYHFGADNNPHLLEGLDIKGTDTMEGANFILCTQAVWTEAEIAMWDVLLQEGLKHKLPMVIPNPDITAMHGNETVWTPGTFGRRYENMGGICHYYGKPSKSIYEEAFRMLAERGFSDKSRFLMVGDTLETDILGAHRAGIDSALVLSGNTGLELNNTPNIHEDYVLEKLESIKKEMGYGPQWVLPSLQWS